VRRIGPAEPAFEVGGGNCALHFDARLGEMLPAFEVKRHDERAGHGARDLYGIIGRECDRPPADGGHTCRADVEERGAHVKVLYP
jgi:hypothetical protein